ncbi:MAG TPA: YncE family protein [Solirubrobacteraceae bacterium]|jgi:DNA-binding beta-propeller fold protein YncE|nr:YncE family protein [Solirubrobacteraceae bacterium]
MTRRRGLAGLFLALLATACGSGQPGQPRHGGDHKPPVKLAQGGTTVVAESSTRTSGAGGGTSGSKTLGRPQALVTDEAQNRVLVVDLPSGRLARRASLPPDPEDIASTGTNGVVVVVSTRMGKVVVLRRSTLRRLKTFGGFDHPHIVGISPDDRYAYVTDDSTGTLAAIRLEDLRVTRRLSVGAGAHHLTFSPSERRVWVALGESARVITIVSTVVMGRPHVVGHFVPGFPVHDLAFSPNGQRVWITSAAGPDVTVFSVRSRRAVFHVPVGAPPQHLAFAGHYVYATSGYGSRIERIDAATGRVVDRATSPYGSFELSVADGYVATVSLLRGTIAIYTPRLRLLRVTHLAPATREVAISRP